MPPEIAPDERAADAECQRLLQALKKRCPDLFVGEDKPLPAGALGPEIPVGPDQATPLFRTIGRLIAGLPTEQPDDPGVVVWTQGEDELAVHVAEMEVVTAEGAVAIYIPVRCDQTGVTKVVVRFAVGSEKRPAGMLASTDERPFGLSEVVDVWGDALVSYAWQMITAASARLADATGRDVDGAGLIPIGLAASRDGLSIATMARHSFDRRAETPA
jgi:hypothetical protein